MLEPLATSCAPTTAPEPSEAVSTLILVAAPAVILKVLELAPVSAGSEVKSKVYPVPVLSIFKPAKVATPLEAWTVKVVVSVPPPGLVPMAAVTSVEESSVTVLPLASWM